MRLLRLRVVNKCLKVTQLADDRVRIQTQVHLILKLPSAAASLSTLPSRPQSELPQPGPPQGGPCLHSSSNREWALSSWRHSPLWELWLLRLWESSSTLPGMMDK